MWCDARVYLSQNTHLHHLHHLHPSLPANPFFSGGVNALLHLCYCDAMRGVLLQPLPARPGPPFLWDAAVRRDFELTLLLLRDTLHRMGTTTRVVARARARAPGAGSPGPGVGASTASVPLGILTASKPSGAQTTSSALVDLAFSLCVPATGVSATGVPATGVGGVCFCAREWHGVERRCMRDVGTAIPSVMAGLA